MDLNIAMQWADALESREFTQGKASLKTPNGSYCCLGVLCELYRREYPETSRWAYDPDGNPIFEILDDSGRVDNANAAYLPTTVVEWGVLRTRMGYYDPEDASTSLAYMNDDGMSFEEIAATIRREAKNL